MRLSRRSVMWLAAIVGIAVFLFFVGPELLRLSGVTGDEADPQNTLAPEGEVADDINDLFVPIAGIATLIFVGVTAATIYFCVAYRRRPGALPRQTHGNTRLEVAWTIAPALLMTAIGIPTLVTLFDLSDQPDNAINVRVVANQWWWEFEYPDLDVVTANEMHVPVGRAVNITLESNDILHSFWVPKLAGKMDVVPNHTNEMWIKADEAGVFQGQCVEFCGLSHALMRFRVIAQPEADFNQWLADQRRPAAPPTDALARQGAQKFATTCAVCHTITGTDARGQVGPSLTHFASRDTFAAGILERTPENIHKWLRNPPGVKPGSKMPNLGLTEDEIQALTAYLQTLR